MQATNIGAIAVLQRAVVGEKLTAAEKTEAQFTLSALAEIIAADAHQFGNIQYHLCNVIEEVKRRSAAAAEAASVA
jgi:tyrosine-protein phosphatase YwqE